MIDCKHVRELAKLRGLTMGELSLRMGFTKETGIYHLLDGDPRQSSLEHLAELLGLSPAEMLALPSRFAAVAIICPHCGKVSVAEIKAQIRTKNPGL